MVLFNFKYSCIFLCIKNFRYKISKTKLSQLCKIEILETEKNFKNKCKVKPQVVQQIKKEG